MPLNNIKKFCSRAFSKIHHHTTSPDDLLSPKEQATLLQLYPMSKISGNGMWGVLAVAQEMLDLCIKGGCCERSYYGYDIIKESLQAMREDVEYDEKHGSSRISLLKEER